jgi:hypothetical protein
VSGLSALLSTSVSSVELFERCPSRWFYRYVQGIKEPFSAAAKEGEAIHEQLEHFLATGNDVLGRTARAGLHLLPSPGVDLLVEHGLNDRPRPKPVNGRRVHWFAPEDSLVRAADVPFVGFIDLVNLRGQTVSGSGEQIVDGLPEVVDHKTSKSFDWAKTEEGLALSTQMNGYGMFVLAKTGAGAVRLSHNNYRTDPNRAPAARKVTTVVSAAQVRERWHDVVDVEVEKMKSVVSEKDVTKVEANLAACGDFGGCPHQSYCHAQTKLNPITRMKMATLLKNRPQPGAPVAAVPTNGAAPWIPPQPPAPPSAAALPIMQQMAAPPAPPAPPPMPQVLAPAHVVAVPAPPPAPAAGPAPIAAGAAVQNARYWVNGQLMQYLCSSNGKQAFMPLVNGQMQGTPVQVPYEVPIFAAAPVQASAPQPPAPALPPAPAVTAPAVPLPPPPAAAPAPRGRGRPRKLVVTDVPDVQAAAAVHSQTAVVSVAQAAAAPAAAQSRGFHLFVNALPNAPFVDLTSYVNEAVEQIREQFGVADIRVAPDDSPLAFGKYKGVLASVVRAEPPAPGTYVAFTKGSEFAEIVVEALWPFAGPGSARAF